MCSQNCFLVIQNDLLSLETSQKFHYFAHSSISKLIWILNHHWLGNFKSIARMFPVYVFLATNIILTRLWRWGVDRNQSLGAPLHTFNALYPYKLGLSMFWSLFANSQDAFRFFVAGNEGIDDSGKLVWFFVFVSYVWKYSYHPSLSDRTHISLGLFLKKLCKALAFINKNFTLNLQEK